MTLNLKRRKRKAKKYVETDLYDGKRIETEVIGETKTDNGIRIGVAATHNPEGVLSSIASVFSGTTNYYATVTINSAGSVVLESKNLSRADFYDRIDRPQEAKTARNQQERRNRFWQKQREKIIKNIIGDPMSMDNTSSVPERCPRCNESGNLLEDQFKKLDDKQFQCRNEECGHIINLR